MVVAEGRAAMLRALVRMMTAYAQRADQYTQSKEEYKKGTFPAYVRSGGDFHEEVLAPSIIAWQKKLNESANSSNATARRHHIPQGCNATQCLPGWIGDHYCDRACNNTECSFDGGDCVAYPRFTTFAPPTNSAEDPYAVAYSQGCDATRCHRGWINDTICDQDCNNAACFYDGNDCGPQNATTSPNSTKTTLCVSLNPPLLPHFYIDFLPESYCDSYWIWRVSRVLHVPDVVVVVVVDGAKKIHTVSTHG